MEKVCNHSFFQYFSNDRPILISFCFQGGTGTEPNGTLGVERLSHSLPGSPADRKPIPFEVVGSAESLVGRVSEGLGWRKKKVYFYFSSLV